MHMQSREDVQLDPRDTACFGFRALQAMEAWTLGIMIKGDYTQCGLMSKYDMLCVTVTFHVL